MSDSPLSLKESRADARPAGMGRPEPLSGQDHRRNLLKGVGVAVSGIAVLVVGGSPSTGLPDLLWVLLAPVVVCAASADWGGRASVRADPRVGQG